MKKCSLAIGSLAVAALLSGACNHSEVHFNKQYLLDPTMDPNKTMNLSNAHLNAVVQAHDIAASAGEASTSGTCPTCGG